MHYEGYCNEHLNLQQMHPLSLNLNSSCILDIEATAGLRDVPQWKPVD